MKSIWKLVSGAGCFLEEIFTRQERVALAFLLGVGLVGLALLGWKGKAPPTSGFVELQVRVNSATAAELVGLPGIGPVLARRIVEDRRRHGRYLTLDDLKRIKGITSKTLEKVQGLVQFD